jgi:17beta-estradiol 17-dehydrogenase / very-long-chain 3-oxoacyl-CoA reductase
MKYLIVGASSGLGKELAYVIAAKCINLILISRDERDLKAIKSDLEYRYKISVEYYAIDVSSTDQTSNLLNLQLGAINDIDGILFPIGMMLPNDKITNSIVDSNKLIQANMGSVIYFISKFLPIFLKKNKGTIVGFGSVSQMMGREENAIYAASKRGLASIFESLSINTLFTNIKVQFYTIGYLDTNLSYGKKIFLPKGTVQELAKIVFKNLNKNFTNIYYPYWWFFIGQIFKIIPFLILKKVYGITLNNKE